MTTLIDITVGSVIKREDWPETFTVRHIENGFILLRNDFDGYMLVIQSSELPMYRVTGTNLKSVTQMKAFLADKNNRYDIFIRIKCKDEKERTAPVQYLSSNIMDQSIYVSGCEAEMDEI